MLDSTGVDKEVPTDKYKQIADKTHKIQLQLFSLVSKKDGYKNYFDSGHFVHNLI